MGISTSAFEGVPERIAEGFVRDQTIMGTMGGFEVVPDQSLVPDLPFDHPIFREMGDVFDLSGFERPRTPIKLGISDLSGVPIPTDIHNVPLKFPGTEYRVPQELRCLEDTLRLCVSVESVVNPNHDEYYAYLTLERTWVDQGRTQRTPKIHSDGLQGQRVNPKVRTEHAYQVCDAYPPRFFTHPFDMTGVDVNIHDMDALYVDQTREEESVTFESNDLVLFDTYCLHQAQQAPRSGNRGFYRLTFADPRRQFDRLGNTRNVLFEQEYESEGWEFQRRPKFELELPPSLAVTKE